MPRQPSKQPAALDASALEAIQNAVFLYEGKPVITLRQMDELHQRPEGTARKAFHRHKAKLLLNKHYNTAQISDLAGLNERPFFTRSNKDSKRDRGGYKGEVTLLYKKGYLLLVKSFNDALAWRVQDMLVDAFELLEATLPNVQTPAVRPDASPEVIADLRGDIADNRREIIATREQLRREMNEEFERLRDFHLEQNRFLFANVRRAQQRMEERLVNTLGAGSGHLIEGARRIVREEFRAFEKRHAAGPASLMTQPEPSIDPDELQRWLPLLATWWAEFGSERKRAGEIASLRDGSLVEGNTARGRSLRLARWLARFSGAVVTLGSLRVRLKISSRAKSANSYWLEADA